MDGGYYSEELISTLIEQNINFIFRMSSSNLFVKNYISDNTIFDVRINNITTKCKIHKNCRFSQVTAICLKMQMPAIVLNSKVQ